MCTVTYLPTGKDSFILTHNRDEQTIRSIAHAPEVEKINNKKVILPRDSKAHGTWIAVMENDKVACLLNGGFTKHIHSPPYRHSRGLIIPTYFMYENIHGFKEDYDLEDVEPFTMIVYEYGNLYEMRWDGKNTFLKSLASDQTYIYSSVTLYSEEAVLEREVWFKEWLDKHKIFKVHEIRDFHCYAGEGDSDNALVMNRADIVQTISITSIEKQVDSAEMIYHDLLNDETTIKSINFEYA